ncbi:Cutinase [Mycobacterium basiliense]|uniref:Cutinase n=1 Tax=Mycobacterium basiliense TaxID=2094119 RepID=A0A447GH66_9MYCO|nr:Cutinase [Mycobacterium basiliense]
MCQHWDVNARRFARLLGIAVVTTGATLSPPILVSSASAAPCPDVEVTFARGTAEPPGVGGVGQAFVDSLRSQVGGRSLGVYPVNYPATEDWPPSASAGANDASAHVESMAANCPDTKLVLGGYSQGAMVIDLITIAQAPVAGFIPQTLSAEVADHVAAVALFGNPSDRYLGGPVSAISPWYGHKAIDLCAPDDPICTPGVLALPSHDEMFSPAHLTYEHSDMPGQAATFVVSQL